MYHPEYKDKWTVDCGIDDAVILRSSHLCLSGFSQSYVLHGYSALPPATNYTDDKIVFWDRRRYREEKEEENGVEEKEEEGGDRRRGRRR